MSDTVGCSTYAKAGLAVPQSSSSTRNAATAIKQSESGAAWARRLQGMPLAALKRDDDDDRQAAAAKLSKDVIEMAAGSNKNDAGESGADMATRLGYGKKGSSR